MNIKTKKIFLRALLLISGILVVILSLLVFSPSVWELLQRELGNLEDKRIAGVLARNQLAAPVYEIEARVAPGYLTVKCLIDVEVRGKGDFQPFLLYEGLNIDSLKLNQQDLEYERWFRRGEVAFWKVYLPEIEPGEKIQLFLVYSGKAPARFRSNGLYSWPADSFWYPQAPGVTNGGINFHCLIDKEWAPLLKGLAMDITSISDKTDLYLFNLTLPFSLTFYHQQTLFPMEKENAGHTFHFLDNLTDRTLSKAWQEKTWGAVYPYFVEKYGDLSVTTHVLLFTDDLRPSSNALYETFVYPPKKKGALTENAPDEFKAEIATLIQGLFRSWWGGRIRADFEGEIFLRDGLADYLAYLAMMDLIDAEQAEEIREGWYAGYLAAINRTGKYQKSLAEICSVLDWQKELALYKAPLVWQGLHHLLGDEAFFGLVEEIYQQYHEETLSLEELRRVAEEIGEVDLNWFFEYFLHSPTALDLEIEAVTSVIDEGVYLNTVSGRNGDDERFFGLVDLQVQTEEETGMERVEFINGRVEFSLETTTPLLAVSLDPEEYWPDLNRKNNGWRREREGETSTEGD